MDQGASERVRTHMRSGNGGGGGRVSHGLGLASTFCRPEPSKARPKLWL